VGLVVVILFAGLFVRVNERSLGWISREKVNQVRSMMENHGFGGRIRGIPSRQGLENWSKKLRFMVRFRGWV